MPWGTKRSLGLLTAAILLVPCVGEAHAATSAQAITWLNAQRAANGLPAEITGNTAWDAGCANHRRWLSA